LKQPGAFWKSPASVSSGPTFNSNAKRIEITRYVLRAETGSPFRLGKLTES
jgi:hypothetical protein